MVALLLNCLKSILTTWKSINMNSCMYDNVPQEIWWECLLRVPSEDLKTVKSVCTEWRDIVNNPNFFHERRKRKLSDEILCMMITPFRSSPKHRGSPCFRIVALHPFTSRWKELPPVPGYEQGVPMFSQCVALKQKLFLISGWNPSTKQAMACVFVYDFIDGRWTRVHDMPTLRSSFACTASHDDGLVYVAGGHDANHEALSVTEVFDVNTGTWTRLPDMGMERDDCEGFFIQGKFIAVSRCETETEECFRESAEAYSAKTGTWETVEGVWSEGCRRSCSMSSENLGLMMCSVSQHALLRYDAAEKSWVNVARLPEKFRPTCVEDCHGKVFLSGIPAVPGCPCCYFLDRDGNTWNPMDRPEEFAGFPMACVSVEI